MLLEFSELICSDCYCHCHPEFVTVSDLYQIVWILDIGGRLPYAQWIFSGFSSMVDQRLPGGGHLHGTLWHIYQSLL